MSAPGGHRDRPGRGPVVVIGIGNEYRRDDAVGLVVAGEVARSALPPGVRVLRSDGEPTSLLAAWAGAALAVLVDAVRVTAAAPGAVPAAGGAPLRPPAAPEPRSGRVHRTELRGGRPAPGSAAPRAAGGLAGSHGLGLPEAVALGRLLGRLPDRLVVYAVEVADVRPGRGLSPAVAAAVAHVTAAVLAEC